MNEITKIKKCAEWLASCKGIWKTDAEYQRLEKLWMDNHDHFGNYKPSESLSTKEETPEISSPQVYQWLQKQKYQTEQGGQEYKMYFDVDMPKILNAFRNEFKSVSASDKMYSDADMISFAEWIETESWKEDYTEQKSHTIAEHFQFYKVNYLNHKIH